MRVWISAGLLAVLLCAACAEAANPARPTPGHTPRSGQVMPATAAPDHGTPAGHPVERVSPGPAVTRALTGTEIAITLAMNGEVVQVPAGRVFLVNLGGESHWTLRWDPQEAVRSWLAAQQPRGSQGYYSLDVLGSRAVLTATPAPVCATAAAGQPCTPAAADRFMVTVVAGPAEHP